MFEEVPPAAIKRVRAADDGSGEKEYLVEWLDAFGDSWVPRRDVADDLVRDFENGLEYAARAAYEIGPPRVRWARRRVRPRAARLGGRRAAHLGAVGAVGDDARDATVFRAFMIRPSATPSRGPSRAGLPPVKTRPPRG